MKGRVAFWFDLLPPYYLYGFVAFKLYGQQCERCKTDRYEQAMWYPEEVCKVCLIIKFDRYNNWLYCLMIRYSLISIIKSDKYTMVFISRLLKKLVVLVNRELLTITNYVRPVKMVYVLIESDFVLLYFYCFTN